MAGRYKTRFWRGMTLVSYWCKSTKFCIAMRGRFAGLDEMAAAVSSGESYILRVVREN